MSTVAPLKGSEHLSTRWSPSVDLSGPGMPVHLEGEIGDVIVRGTIPDVFDGTFYRVGQDQPTPFQELLTPLGGNGIVSAFRIHKGQVDFKIRYVQTDRYKVERNIKRSLWEEIAAAHPLIKHPCVRAVMDQSSNTNVLFWGGSLLAMGELGLAYTMDPDTLETTGVDPFGDQLVSDRMTAHPKIDGHVQEFVTYGLSSDLKELVSYSVDRQNIVKNEHRIKLSDTAACHDMAMTENWLIFCLWPNAFSEGGDALPSLVWDTERPASFIVAPRHPERPLEGSGWKPYESRMYTYPINSEIVHTAGAWEENGKIMFEGTWPHGTWFEFWGRKDGKEHPPKDEKVAIELVRFEIDPSKPAESQLADPVVLVDIPNEFCRIDERYYNKPYDHIFMNVYSSPTNETALHDKHVYHTLNATAMLIKSTGELKVFAPGPECRCAEPVFIPRSADAPEGDGYVIFVVDRLDVNLTNLVILDTKEFEKPVAVIELPLKLRGQIHGNWVDASELSGKPLVAPPKMTNMTWKRRSVL